MSVRSTVAAAVSIAAFSLMLAGCETDGTPGPVARATPEQRQTAIDSLTHDVPPTSIEMARGQCWMAQEKTRNVDNLDAKIAAVDQCVEEKKKKYPMLAN